MRSWIVLLAALFVLSGLAPQSIAQGGDPQGGDDEEGAQTQGNQTRSNETHGNQTQGNETHGNQTQGNPNQNRSGPPNPPPGQAKREENANPNSARADEADRRKAQARAWQDAMDSRGQEHSADQREKAMADLPPHVRDRLGLLVEEDGIYRGTYVSFAPDRQTGILHDVTGDGTLLFSEIYAPVALGSTASISASAKVFHVSGDAWDFRLSDHASVAMKFKTQSDDSFMLVVPSGTTLTQTTYGVEIVYPGDGGNGRIARLVGAAALDPADDQVILVDGEATFHVSAERTLLTNVANQARPQLEAALQQRNLGAEATVLRASDFGILDETVLYEDMTMAIREGAREMAEGMAAYTITVASDHRPGKTVVVNFESGLLDPDHLTFRYWNIHEDREEEATIVQAASLAAVLNPSEDGIAQYWIVNDIDGTQVILSIPHFSVHQFELMSIMDFVQEHPSLVIGTIGAILLVAVATGAMFRRPEDA